MLTAIGAVLKNHLLQTPPPTIPADACESHMYYHFPTLYATVFVVNTNKVCLHSSFWFG